MLSTEFISTIALLILQMYIKAKDKWVYKRIHFHKVVPCVPMSWMVTGRWGLGISIRGWVGGREAGTEVGWRNADIAPAERKKRRKKT